jgi:hypothetical protein
MNAFGIEFGHRRPGQEPYVAKDFAEFTAFAALCYARGVSRYVDGVFFDTKSQTFNIDVAQKYDTSPEGSVIAACAQATLPQFVMFGDYWCRDNEL